MTVFQAVCLLIGACVGAGLVLVTILIVLDKALSKTKWFGK